MATLQADLDADMADAIDLFDETFTWQGTTYDCVLNDHGHSLVTRKANFPSGRYPRWGELITVAGKVRQITKMNGSMLVSEDGRRVEVPPFVDRPDNTVLELEFDVQLKA